MWQLSEALKGWGRKPWSYQREEPSRKEELERREEHAWTGWEELWRGVMERDRQSDRRWSQTRYLDHVKLKWDGELWSTQQVHNTTWLRRWQEAARVEAGKPWKWLQWPSWKMKVAWPYLLAIKLVVTVWRYWQSGVPGEDVEAPHPFPHTLP